MNDVAELKQYAAAHASSQKIEHYQELLDRIRTDDHDKPGSWIGEWCRAGRLMESRGKDLEASRYYAMARFPFVDCAARQEALDRGVRALDRWRSTGTDVQSLRVDLDGGQVRCWTAGLTPGGKKPLLVLMGGIVTVKEQWAPVLTNLRGLGMAGIVTEMPGTGENTLRYGPESWRMLSSLLDTVADRADVSNTYTMALSFSGHMALQCASEDSRIRGIVTMGAPVAEFFTDTAWQRQLPKVTVDTVAHMIGISPDSVAGALGDWALSEKQLESLDIPVSYVASKRDEIIPRSDSALLREHVARLDLVENDDVHGSPQHQREMRLWMIDALLRARGTRNARSVILGVLLRMARRKGGHSKG